MSVKYISSIVVILLFQSATAQCPKYIEDFYSIEEKKQEIDFINKYQNSTDINVKPYLIAIKMKQSEYASLPWKKLEIFNAQKSNLEKFIKKHPDNIHARYMRYVIQVTIPSILGYQSDYKNDEKFIKKKIANVPQCLKNNIADKIDIL